MKTEEVAQDSNLRRSSGMPGPPARSTSDNAINRLRVGILSRANANANAMSLPRTSSNGDDSNTQEQRREIAPSPVASSSSRISSRDAAESPQSSNLRRSTRGRKRNAPQPRAENSTSSLSEDRTTTETHSNNRRTRRRTNSHLSLFGPSSAAMGDSISSLSEDRATTETHSNNRRTRRRTSSQLSLFELFEPSSAAMGNSTSSLSEDRATTETHSNNRRTRRRTNSQLSLFEPSSAAMGESSTRGSLTGGSRGHSLFPFSSGSRVQQLRPFPEVSSADMESPIQTLIDSVSAPTRVASTVSASSSPSTQSQSITLSRAMHIMRTSTGRSEGEQNSLGGGARQESRFIPRTLERMLLPENITDGAESSGRDERPAPFRRRTNVLVSMHRLQVWRPPLSGNDSIPNQGIQEDNSIE
jgi:hypothetical protein